MDRIHAATQPRRLTWLGALAAAMFLAAPEGARAGDEFEDGFKDELGRLAAHQAVVVGRGVLAQVLLGGYPGYYYPVDYPTHRPHYYDRGHERGYDHGHGHYRHHGGYPGYYPRWGHAYGGHRWGHYGHPRNHHHHHHRHHHHHGCGH